MPKLEKRSKYKRSNLFLLRVWCDDHVPGLDENENEKGDKDERSDSKWHGRVQRTVSGEAHNFEGKEDLIAVLEKMLY